MAQPGGSVGYQNYFNTGKSHGDGVDIQTDYTIILELVQSYRFDNNDSWSYGVPVQLV